MSEEEIFTLCEDEVKRLNKEYGSILEKDYLNDITQTSFDDALRYDKPYRKVDERTIKVIVNRKFKEIL